MADPNKGSDLNLGNPVVDWAVNTVVDVFSGANRARAPSAADVAVLRDAGWQLGTVRGGTFVPGLILPGKGQAQQVWQNPAGQTYSLDAARRAAGELRVIGRAPPIPPGHDTITVPAIPLPAIPPIIGALPWPTIAGPIIAGGLMWPRAAGPGSDLRDLYGMPKPKAAPGRRGRGRRRRTRAKPRGLPGRGNPFPGAAAPGRGGPVTIRTRPAGPVVAPAARVVSPAWKPSKAVMPPVKIPKQVITAPAPAKVPMTRTQAAGAKARAVASSPLFKFAESILGSPLFNLFAPRARAPSLGNITLPGQGPAPGVLPSPLTASNPLGLTYARALATSAAAEQDCSCRPARKKRKGKPCKNPVTSRRSFKRNGSKFVTTTKEIKCQASSRKKPRLRPVP